MQEATFKVFLALESELNATQLAAFEKGTKTWLEETKLDTGSLSDVEVEVITQKVVETELPLRRRSLQGGKPAITRKDLEVAYTVSATYTGKDPDFDMESELDPKFQGKNTLWLRELNDQDDVFAALNPVISGISDLERQKQLEKKKGASAMTVALVILAVVAAVTMGLAASVYSVRTHRRAMYGDELPSQISGMQSAIGQSTDEDKIIPLKKPSRTFDHRPTTVEPIVENSARTTDISVINDRPMKDPPTRNGGTQNQVDPASQPTASFTSPTPPPPPMTLSDQIRQNQNRENFRQNAIFDNVSILGD